MKESNNRIISFIALTISVISLILSIFVLINMKTKNNEIDNKLKNEMNIKSFLEIDNNRVEKIIFGENGYEEIRFFNNEKLYKGLIDENIEKIDRIFSHENGTIEIIINNEKFNNGK